jgi:hypothetical protein
MVVSCKVGQQSVRTACRQPVPGIEVGAVMLVTICEMAKRRDAAATLQPTMFIARKQTKGSHDRGAWPWRRKPAPVPFAVRAV